MQYFHFSLWYSILAAVFVWFDTILTKVNFLTLGWVQTGCQISGKKGKCYSKTILRKYCMELKNEHSKEKSLNFWLHLPKASWDAFRSHLLRLLLWLICFTWDSVVIPIAAINLLSFLTYLYCIITILSTYLKESWTWLCWPKDTPGSLPQVIVSFNVVWQEHR